MKVGFASAILPDLSLVELLRFAAEAGFDSVEVMCWPKGKAERRYAGVTHVDVSALDDEAAGAIREIVSASGVSISALGYYPNPLTPDPEEAAVAVEHLRAVIRAAKTLGVPNVNTFIGRDWTVSLDANWPRFLEVWEPLIAYAEEHDVLIGIENCPMLFTGDEWPGGKNLATSPAIWRRMFDAIPSPNFGLNYDPSHMVWQQMDYLAPMREFADRIHHAHAKDVRIDVEKLNAVGVLAHPLEYHTPKLPGLGAIDWGAFFLTLSDTGYAGHVAIEVEDCAYEGSVETRKASLRQSANYLRQFVDWR